MASISGKETKPEIAVRGFLFRQGFRFRKNVKTLPGKPDIVLPKYKTVIFINGCFWHGHNCKKGARPHSNIAFWENKIQGNILRDGRMYKDLRKKGWKVLVIWECKITNKRKFNDSMAKTIDKIIM